MRQEAFTINGTLCANGVFFLRRRARAFLTFIACSFFYKGYQIASERLTRISVSTNYFRRFKRAIRVASYTIIVSKSGQIIIQFNGHASRIKGTFLRFQINTLCNIRLGATNVLTHICKESDTSTRASTMIIAAWRSGFFTQYKVTLWHITRVDVASATNRRSRFIMDVFFLILFIFRYRSQATSRQLSRLIARVKYAIKNLSRSLFQDLMRPKT